ncbi:Uncharacterised protein [Vibrio cholerae]|nr:Uncharacterised protein [Vibrio cholerae]
MLTTVFIPFALSKTSTSLTLRSLTCLNLYAA